MKFEADAVVSPHKPYPAPKSMKEPWATPDAELRRAGGGGSLRHIRMGVEEGSPSLALLVATKLRCVVAGELAGTWGDSGGIGPRLTNFANVALVAFASNQ